MIRVKMQFTLQQIGKMWGSGGKTAKRWGRKNPAVIYAQRYPKDVKKTLRLHVVARGASATPPLGPTLGQYGIPIIKFCDQFNSASSKFKRHTKLVVTLYQTYDNDFYFEFNLPMTSVLLKKVARLYKGSGQPGQVYSKHHLIELMEKKLEEDALLHQRSESTNSAREEKYAELDPRVQKKNRNKNRLRRKPAKRKSYHTKHQNVVGHTRFVGVTPQMLYEVCLLKYFQYLNCGLYAFNMKEFDSRYSRSTADTDKDKESNVVEPRNAPLYVKYRNIFRTYESGDAFYTPTSNTYNASTIVMRPLFRLCKGTMRTMGLFLVPDKHTLRTYGGNL